MTQELELDHTRGEMDEHLTLSESPLVIHRKEELDLITAQIETRLKEAEFQGGLINIGGLAGMGKSTFIEQTLIPNLESKYQEVPVVDINLDIYKDETRSDLTHSKAKLALDLLRGLEGKTGIPVEDMLKSNKHKSLGRWNQAMEVLEGLNLSETEPYEARGLEEAFVLAFREYTFALAHQKRRPVVIVLDTYDHATAEEDKWIQEELMNPTLDTGLFVWVVAGRKEIRAKNKNVEKNLVLDELSEFSPKEVSQMVGKDEVAATAYQYAKGHPEATAAIAETVTEFYRQEQMSDTDSVTENDRLRQEIIETISGLLKSERYLGGLGGKTVGLMDSLSGFESFDLRKYAELLNKEREKTGGDSVSVNQLLKQLTDLVETGFVSRDGTNYQVVEPIRSLMQEIKAH